MDILFWRLIYQKITPINPLNVSLTQNRSTNMHTTQVNEITEKKRAKKTEK